MENKHLDSITGLRAVLAFSVLFYHGWNWTHPIAPDNPLSWTILELGSCGVSGFFILSGFILTYVYSERHASSKSYFVNRFARIYPLYILGLAFAFPLDWFSPGMPQEGKTTSLFLSIGLLQSWWPLSTGRFNGPGWTICVEALFYLVFPAALWLKNRAPKTFIGLALAVIVSTYIVWDDSNFETGKWFPAMHLCEFFLGMLAAPLSHKIKRPSVTAAIFLLLITPAVAAFVRHSGYHDGIRYASIAFLNCSAIMLLARSDSLGRGSIFSSRWMILSGEISYGVYLLHHSFQRYARVFVERQFDTPIKDTDLSIKLIWFFGTTFATCITSYYAWKYVEIPARSYLRSRLSSKTQ